VVSLKRGLRIAIDKDTQMSQIIVLIIAAAAVLLALLLAYVPMRLLLTQMARQVAAPIREFIQRQRDRRELERGTPDRRRT
jgi:uncharacterized protein YqfA (UPF0365 family)